MMKGCGLIENGAHGRADGAPSLRLAQKPTPREGGYYAKGEWLVEIVTDGRFAVLKQAEQSVLIVLLSHASDAWEAWPSVPTLEQETGQSSRTITRACEGLLARGAISLVHAGGGRASNRYRIELGPWNDEGGPSRMTSDTPANLTPQPRNSDGAPPPNLRGTPVNLTGHPRKSDRGTGIREREKENVADVGARIAIEPEPSLWADHDAIQLLIERGFADDDAAQVTREYGAEAVRQGVSYADFKQRMKEIRRSYRHCCMAAIKGGWGPDERELTEKREKARAAAQALHQADQQATFVRTVFERATPEQVEAARVHVIALLPSATRAKLRDAAADHPELAATIAMRLKRDLPL
jgi:hypothetical protein